MRPRGWLNGLSPSSEVPTATTQKGFNGPFFFRDGQTEVYQKRLFSVIKKLKPPSLLLMVVKIPRTWKSWTKMFVSSAAGQHTVSLVAAAHSAVKYTVTEVLRDPFRRKRYYIEYKTVFGEEMKTQKAEIQRGSSRWLEGEGSCTSRTGVGEGTERSSAGGRSMEDF